VEAERPFPPVLPDCPRATVLAGTDNPQIGDVAMARDRFYTVRNLLLWGMLPLFLAHGGHAMPYSPPPTPAREGARQGTEVPTTPQKNENTSSAEGTKSPAASPASRQEQPAIEKLAKNTYRIGGVTVDTKERLVTFPARINLREGVLEVLICTEYGKTHESLLSTKVNPLHLNVAFLLLGLEGGHAVKYQGDPTKPVGSPVEIWFQVKEADKEKTVRAEDWVYNNHAKRPMLHTHWVYVGSVLTEDGFMAQREGQIATTFHDPFALIDNPLPGGGDDTVYTPNTKQLPPLGTELTVLIKCGPVRRWEPPLPGASR
jgi:hypothetical protein